VVAVRLSQGESPSFSQLSGAFLLLSVIAEFLREQAVLIEDDYNQYEGQVEGGSAAGVTGREAPQPAIAKSVIGFFAHDIGDVVSIMGKGAGNRVVISDFHSSGCCWWNGQAEIRSRDRQHFCCPPLPAGHQSRPIAIRFHESAILAMACCNSAVVAAFSGVRAHQPQFLPQLDGRSWLLKL
jgi:uncharacterized protein YodC (DUF2158 family)